MVNGRFLFADGTGFDSSIGLKRGSPDIGASGCFEQLQSGYAEAPISGPSGRQVRDISLLAKPRFRGFWPLISEK